MRACVCVCVHTCMFVYTCVHVLLGGSFPELVTVSYCSLKYELGKLVY